ncbi:hypothetical protein M407DRAFT_244055 [Tulasnella calospora MUT 4182]|uniref:Uncharacterized protein n=1 Tax=Tulasnella calospora MUT 4182 TaxID=1051891 RepID=A0A0C3Q7G1_9AGAM|nr:hypothetical protein M407DRAFT_244055 [Tulasnella calospora MUT 4182]
MRQSTEISCSAQRVYIVRRECEAERIEEMTNRTEATLLTRPSVHNTTTPRLQKEGRQQARSRDALAGQLLARVDQARSNV